MEAKLSQRVRLNGRTPLHEVLPLRTPFHIFVDPSAACNFSCKFCFNKDKSRTFHKIMKYDLFVKIVNDLKQFPQKLKVLRLYKEGEPLMNKRLPEMIAYAKGMEVAETIDLTTNGSMLTPEKNLQLINAGLDAINISVEALTDEKYHELSRVKLNFKNFVENIRHFYNNKGNCRVLIKTNDIGVPKEEEQKFYDIFGDICDEISIEQIVPIWNNVDISDIKTDYNKGIYNQQISDISVCPYIFYSMSINSDGSVSSCFSDWEHTNIIGDINKESVFDVWNGKSLMELRVAHLKKEKHLYPACAGCKQLAYVAIDNIDSYAEALLQRFQ